MSSLSHPSDQLPDTAKLHTQYSPPLLHFPPPHLRLSDRHSLLFYVWLSSSVLKLGLWGCGLLCSHHINSAQHIIDSGCSINICWMTEERRKRRKEQQGGAVINFILQKRKPRLRDIPVTLLITKMANSQQVRVRDAVRDTLPSPTTKNKPAAQPRILWMAKLSLKNEGEFATKWMAIEGIMLIEISQMEKDKYHNDLTYMWNLKNKWKDKTKWKQTCRYREQMNGCQMGVRWEVGWNRGRGLRDITSSYRVIGVENKLMVTGWGEEGGRINWEFGIDIYTLLPIK